LPNALAIGVPYDVFWHLNPKKLQSFYKAYKIKQKMQDEQSWMLGIYFESAAYTAVSNALANAFGKKCKAEYMKKPIMSKIEDDTGLTQEEIDERELKKMILAEEQWIRNDKERGLPTTVIK
jgi:hypothetical protein